MIGEKRREKRIYETRRETTRRENKVGEREGEIER